MRAADLLGIDNVLFAVDDLDAAIAFYEDCGLPLRFRREAPGIALLAIGTESPGLLLRHGDGGGGALWVEVPDAEAAAASLVAKGISVTRLETGTGLTVEARDPSGNTIGFADYRRRPDMARAAAR